MRAFPPLSSSSSAQREQHSLFGEILDWMLAPLLLLWPMSVALTWLVAQNIAARPYDRDLAQLTRLIARQMAAEAGPAMAGTPLRLPESAAALLRSDDVDRVYFQVLGSQGELIAGDHEVPLPDLERSATGEVQFRDETIQNESVRVASLRPAAGETALSPIFLVQVAETLDKRSRLATEIIKGVILPQFVILPLAVLLVWFALARGIAPLNQLQQRIRQRESHDLSPIDERDAPEEVAPLVRSINDLLARLDQSMGSQKHFLADAAHQLKTPLAGLRTQAELAQREIDASGDPRSVKRSLQQIALSSQRAAHMVNQLLAMARAEDEEQARRQMAFNLVRLATEVVQDFISKSLDKRIDLGYEGPDVDDTSVPRLVGQPLLVRELIRNLVDNALQYTPEGGTVTVRIMPDPFGQVMVLQVEDNGPGIPEAERELVLQPFYRALGTNVDGSGLGLAIVKEIVDKHSATMNIDFARAPSASAPNERPGTLFTIRFSVPEATA
ncbi:MAG: sensor histidine kinase N-terminal domain-containing protein [Vitreoscilla sp.]|nr:sensor histidine kinase N-terminal domain-containing protein [Burkholderiales bacterium]MBP6338166.1 sensor histidine kinase N-terminal domain-containing protein [Vitreoscilla sp.]MBP6676930.1 sensor histidine kinase N-terminal domain-containing protein [Vitreoscilla sp.]